MSLQIGMNFFPLKEVNIENKKFCSSFKNLKILQLSDLHLNKKIKISYLNDLVDLINNADPDIVVFTGDIIQTKASNIQKHIEVFKNIKAHSYFVSGNHDIFYGVDELKKEMLKSNIVCMDNKITTLHVKDMILQIVGVSDRYSFIRGIKRDIKELFAKLDTDLPTIFLAHQPKDIEYIGSNRIDIQLSGHTHGGQIYPFSLLVKLFQPYFSGLYKYKNTVLYVSNGLGYWGVDIRYKAKSEVTLLTIN